MIIKTGNQEIGLKTSGIDFEDTKFENINAYKFLYWVHRWNLKW